MKDKYIRHIIIQKLYILSLGLPTLSPNSDIKDQTHHNSRSISVLIIFIGFGIEEGEKQPRKANKNSNSFKMHYIQDDKSV